MQSTINYTYGNSSWKDLLTSYNGGATIEYDSIGNPTSYHNESAYTFTWNNGRELTSGTKGSTSFSYAYNASGLRTSKTVNGVTHNYVWAGGLLLAETWGSNSMYFDYNGGGALVGFSYNGTYYLYAKNMQGDIVGRTEHLLVGWIHLRISKCFGGTKIPIIQMDHIIIYMEQDIITQELLYLNPTQQSIFRLNNIGGKGMPTFSKDNIQELKDLLYNSCVHDAKLENIEYNVGQDYIRTTLLNPIFNVKMDLIFQNIEIALAIKGNEYGSPETIISLTAEADFSYLQTYLPNYNECIESSLYLLFQMFSGDELHIVSKEVVVKIIRLQDNVWLP